MKDSTTKISSSNLHIQNKQESQPFFQKAGNDAFFQPKLTIGQPNDKYEQEADDVADTVVQKLEQPTIQNKCNHCEQEEKVQKKEQEEESDALIQEKPIFESEAKIQSQTAESPLSHTSTTEESTTEKELKQEETEEETEPDLQLKPIFESAEDSPEEESLMAKSTSGELQAGDGLQQKLNQSKGGGSPLPEDTRSSMENSFGADFSNVNIHTGADAVAMNKDLGAHAFAHGSDIYFNEGKYDPSSSSGKHLLAHELTHTVQQGGSTVKTKKETEEEPAEYSTNDAPNVQAAWYNFDIPFTDYQFDPSIQGVKNAAGIAKDAAVDTAVWVKDKAVGAFQWIYDKIKGLIDSGIDWLNGKFEEIKEFATSSFDTIKNSLGNLLGYITSPVSLITTAFDNMDADLLESAWNALTAGANFVWKGMKSVIDGVFSLGTNIWDTVSGYVSNLLGTVNSLIDSWPFRQLPEALQSGAKGLLNDLRELWRSISDFISKTLKDLKAFTDRVLSSIEKFIRKVVSSAIKTVIATVRKIKAAWVFVKEIADDPEGFIRPVVGDITAKLNSEAVPKAIELGNQRMQENYKGDPSADLDIGTVQRSPDDSATPATEDTERSTASFSEVGTGFTDAIVKAWAGLDIGKMLWETFVNMFWPPATIKAIGHEFYELWTKDWTNAWNSFFVPRNIIEEPVGFFHDVWSNLLVFLDFPLALWRRLNAILMLLLGYLTVILVIIGAIGGAIGGAAAGGVGAIPGAWAGALAGLETAGAIGHVLLISYFAAEGITVVKSFVDLFTARQTQNEKNNDYTQIAGSLIGMAIAAILVAILWFLSQLIAAIVKGIKAGSAKGEVEVKPPTEEVKAPTEEVKAPREEAKPPSEEVKAPEEVKPPPEEVRGPPNIEAVKEPITLDGKPHTISIEKMSDGSFRLRLCTGCDALIKRCIEILEKITDPVARGEVESIMSNAKKLQEKINNNTVTAEEAAAEIARMGESLEKAASLEPEAVGEVVEGKTGVDSGKVEVPGPETLDVQHTGGSDYILVEKGMDANWGMVEIVKDAPNTYIYPHEAIVRATGESVHLTSKGAFSWTREALRLMIETHEKVFGSKPANLPGALAESNKLNFQKEFVKIREANPTLSPAEVSNLAIREISFGKHRIAEGYGDIEVKATRPETVSWTEKGPGGEEITVSHPDVPTSINVEAKPN